MEGEANVLIDVEEIFQLDWVHLAMKYWLLPFQVDKLPMSNAKQDLAYLFRNSSLSPEIAEDIVRWVNDCYDAFSVIGDIDRKRTLWAEAVFESYNQIKKIVTPNSTLNSWHKAIADLRETKSSTSRLDLEQNLEDIFREKVKDHTKEIDIVDNMELEDII